MPTYSIDGPDGKTYSIDGPEGATREQVIAKIKEQQQSQSQAGTSEAAPSTMGDVAKSFGGGVEKGIIGLAGAPSDLGDLGAKGIDAVTRFTQRTLGLSESAPYDSNQSTLLPKLPGAEKIRSGVEQVAGPLYEPKTTAGKYAQSVGEFVPSAVIGPGGLAAKAATTVAGGLGSEAAGELTEGTGLEPYARAAGGLIAGSGTGLAAAERGTARMNAALPTMEKIKAAATAAYDQLKKSNVRISEQGTQELATDIQSTLHNDNFRDYLAPNTYRALAEFPVKGGATIGDIDGLRKLLGRVPVTNPTDREAASRAIDAIDDWIANVPQQHVVSGDPAFDAALLKHAQGNWASYKKLEMFGKAEDQAEHRAGASGSGANKVNTQRQEIRKILDSDKKSRGLSPEVKAKMEEIIMGTTATNATRKVGKLAPTGAVSAIPTMGAAIYGGTPAAAATAIGGSAAKWLSEYLTERQMGQLDRLLREESPIGKPVAAAQAPERASNSMVAPAAALRSALAVESPLAQPGQ